MLRPVRSALFAAGVVALGLAHPAEASAYELHVSETGAPVHWEVPRVELVVDGSVSAIDGARGAIEQAVGAWNGVSDEAPELASADGEGITVGYDPKGRNTNAVVYAPDGWRGASGPLAVTIVTFVSSTGAIVDADIVIDGKDRHFGSLSATAGQNGASGVVDEYDVGSVVTHELGHLLGLADESDDEQATMYLFTTVGETSKQTLSSDDVDGLAALYPGAAGAAPAGCSATVAPGRSASNISGWALVALAASAIAVAFSARRGRGRRGFSVAAMAVALGMATSAPPVAHARGPADLRVTSAPSKWENGLIVTDVRLTAADCSAECAETEIRVLGGRIGDLEQVALHEGRAPRPGDVVRAPSGSVHRVPAVVRSEP